MHHSEHTITTGPRPTYLKSHASQWTHNHHWSQADIPKITCITVNTITTGPMSTSMKLYRTHHRKHTITTRPMSTYHTHTENTISIISYASHKTQSPPELCPHVWNCMHHKKHTITTGPRPTYVKSHQNLAPDCEAIRITMNTWWLLLPSSNIWNTHYSKQTTSPRPMQLKSYIPQL